MNLGFSQSERTKNVTGDIRYQGQWGEVLVNNKLYQIIFIYIINGVLLLIYHVHI